MQKTALVTGGGRGIGRAVALRLADLGVDVAIASRTMTEVDAVAAEVRARGRRAASVSLDVSKADSVRAAFAAARAELGPITILVNGAGVAPSAPLLKTSDETWHDTLQTNLTGAFYTIREALPGMVEAGWGRVVNVASIAGKTGYPYISAYSASKHGLIGLTRCAALEMAERGITVNAVCPGYVDTAMTDVSIERMVKKTGLDAGDLRRRLEHMSPQKRLFTPDEVAALVVYLCGDDARGITGQALSVDGGTVVA
jgi:3-hydroxybutyrate dehydrogenase